MLQNKVCPGIAVVIRDVETDQQLRHLGAEAENDGLSLKHEEAFAPAEAAEEAS
jgi:hypothetical protein